ncbi:MAG: hypothetical protein P8N44_00500 [Flavobacteriaceae bacterium]|jgi:hypothetical protein|nr:hypothetical protein [Flavobacteriaceae bacterium]MDG1884594.1 hypothetical protein [Flavobacteriaceae bacterium]
MKILLFPSGVTLPMVPSSSKFTAYIFPSKSVAGPSIPLVKLPSGAKIYDSFSGITTQYN